MTLCFIRYSMEKLKQPPALSNAVKSGMISLVAQSIQVTESLKSSENVSEVLLPFVLQS